MYQLIDFLNNAGVVTPLITLACIAAMLWYTALCSEGVTSLCQECKQECKEEIRREREAPSILVQASPDMTAAQLACLLQDAEAIIQAQQATVAQS